MAIEKDAAGNITFTGEHIRIYRLLALRSALGLEARTGMKMSRGRSALSVVKAEFGLKGNSIKVFLAFDKLLRERGVVRVDAPLLCQKCAKEIGSGYTITRCKCAPAEPKGCGGGPEGCGACPSCD